MSQPRERAKHSSLRSELRRSVAVSTLAGTLVLLVLGDRAGGLAALAGWALYAAVVYRAAIRADLPGFGWAGRVTLLRGLLVALMIPDLLAPGLRPWLPLVLGAMALALDGVDGPVARRTGTASPFGARFDMETDEIGRASCRERVSINV